MTIGTVQEKTITAGQVKELGAALVEALPLEMQSSVAQGWIGNKQALKKNLRSMLVRRPAVIVCVVGVYVGFLLNGFYLPGHITSPGRLEPMIFTIYRLWLDRLLGRGNERALKEEIGRQERRAEAVQQAKETAERERDVMEEKNKGQTAKVTSLPAEHTTNWSPAAAAAARILDT